VPDPDVPITDLTEGKTPPPAANAAGDFDEE
jgi:hypothetical protein